LDELNLGKKIQDLRLAHGLSVRKVANLANITPSMLSQIENGLVNPSINTLRAIAQVLDTPLYNLFKEEQARDMVVHPETRLVIGSAGEPDVHYQLLTPDTKGDIEFCMMVIPPHCSSYRDIKSHIGEEVAYVCSGDSVELDLDGTSLTLKTGDSVRIPANVPHVWHNHADITVQVVFAITPPTF
jgi:transcriptional regulator with XRE-family HTH domain